jgi:CRISPR-associated protein Cas1
MPALYLVQQNTKIRIRNRRLQVEREAEDGSPAEVLTSVPLGQVSQVVLFGNIGLTTPAIDALLAQETEVVFLTQRGEFRGKLVGNLTPHVPLRRAQYRALEKPEFALKMAQGFVRAKLQHQKALLLRNSREERAPAIGEAAERLNQALEAVERKTTLDSLRGLEGASTAAYFSGLRAFFAPEWRFQDRNRRPPADPVNVLLSFGYTLLAQAASAAVQTVGLDPFVGFLHEYVYNRPALALDLMEEFRPVIDGVVLWCCRSGVLTPQGDFTAGPPERPVVLDDDGKRRFLQAYENRMEQTSLHPLRGQKLSLRQAMIEQARQVADALMSDKPAFTGMGFR